MIGGELREPGKSFAVYTSEDGKKVVDHYLYDPEGGQIITAVFGLEPMDMMRCMRAYKSGQLVSLQEYVHIMTDDENILDIGRDASTMQ